MAHLVGVNVAAVLLLLIALSTYYPSSTAYANVVLGRKGAATVDEPAAENTAAGRYAVIFDAGSTGSRVHVFKFDEQLDLVPIGDDIEFFAK